MTAADVHAFLNRFAHAWEEGDLVTLADCYTSDCEVVSPIFHTLHGLSQVENSFRAAFRAFSAQTMRVDEVIVDGDNPGQAAVVWTSKVKHQGEIFGIPPTGKVFEVTIALFLKFANGKIAREVRVYDFTKMLMEIGVMRMRGQQG